MVVRSLSGLGLSGSFYFVLEFGKFEKEFLFFKNFPQNRDYQLK